MELLLLFEGLVLHDWLGLNLGNEVYYNKTE